MTAAEHNAQVQAWRRQRLEDVAFLADTGEILTRAARRLGIAPDSLAKWCAVHAPAALDAIQAQPRRRGMTCAWDGCDAPVNTRGHCDRHYYHFRKSNPKLPRRTPIQNLFAKTDRSGGPDACWPWLASVSKTGYGRFWLKDHGGVMYAHRAAYILLVGPVPAGYHVDHLCRNRACVNPAHLEPVTPAENNRRGLVARGHACPNGHIYSPDNIYIIPKTGGRSCRICRYEATQRRRARERAARDHAPDLGRTLAAREPMVVKA